MAPAEPMAARLPVLCLLLGMWAIPDHGGATWIPAESDLRLTRGGCQCTGILEVKWENQWRPICWENMSVGDLAWICQQLKCGLPTSEPLEFNIPGGKGLQSLARRCSSPPECQWELENCTDHVIVACGEPVKTTPKPPPTPPTTTPEPTGPPRLRLVDGNFSCSGFLELHKQGLWGAVASIPRSWTDLVTLICQELRCGTAGSSHGKPDPGIHLPVRWEAVESCGSRSLLDCFNRSSSRGKAPAFITCSDSQPRALRRLAAGPTSCEGDIQVFHAGQWWDLCESRAAQRDRHGRQICRELGCGNLTSSTEIREPPSTGVTCGLEPLHLCQPKPGNSRSCSRTRVVCQDSKPPPTGTSAGTVVSICLALLLFLILSLICGPPAYRKLMKRISKKKQRQWIGPTGLNQTGEELLAGEMGMGFGVPGDGSGVWVSCSPLDPGTRALDLASFWNITHPGDAGLEQGPVLLSPFPGGFVPSKLQFQPQNPNPAVFSSVLPPLQHCSEASGTGRGQRLRSAPQKELPALCLPRSVLEVAPPRSFSMDVHPVRCIRALHSSGSSVPAFQPSG
uniref:SRCR domain-containing protein n=1 Tax=Junco hyemalis TaxID=40217 RepID=A0A8C5IRW7_JUNHY